MHGFFKWVFDSLELLNGFLEQVVVSRRDIGIRKLLLPCFSGLAILLELVWTSGVWPDGLLDAYIAMIPKADGDSTPLGQRPLSVLPVVYRLWASLRLGHLLEWVEMVT